LLICQKIAVHSRIRPPTSQGHKSNILTHSQHQTLDPSQEQCKLP
jgi:hypothetical protein